MEIVLTNIKSKNSEIFSLKNFDSIHETFKKFPLIKGPLEAKIFAINETLNSCQLSKLKNHFDKINICSLQIYSNNRDTVLSGKSLKIDSAFIKEQKIKNIPMYEFKDRSKILYLIFNLILTYKSFLNECTVNNEFKKSEGWPFFLLNK